jgi:asparagine synthase (glutamine-hydrolysing)
VVFNGEIYNYRELREELCRAGEVFYGASDTEVLARGYLHWGADLVNRLRGMWAFAILDQRSQSLLCSRDPFGIKPFYYAWQQGAFIFASEPQALLRAGIAARANVEVAAQYLVFGIVDHTRQCFFRGITQLDAGETVVVTGNGQLRPAVRLNPYAREEPDATTEELTHNLRESVGLHLRSDVPVGTCLSGGLDSSTIAAFAADMVRAADGPRFAAVTAASDEAGIDERHFAATVVQHCDLAWHVVQPSAQEFSAQIEECLRAQGEPALSPSVYLQYCVMRAARYAGLKVMLDGQGADELLCGYERYVALWAQETARSAGVLQALRGFLGFSGSSRQGLWGMAALAAYVLAPALRRQIIARRAAFLRAELRPAVDEVVNRLVHASSDLHSARVSDLAGLSLPALLRYEDRNSMAHSIEARVPYVDRSVVACALRFADTQLLKDGFTKYPLRMIAAQVLPSEIAWRRGKIGFEPPTQRWLAPLRDQMQQQTAGSDLLRYLCPKVPRLESLPLALQWRLYSLASWQRLFAVQ